MEFIFIVLLLWTALYVVADILLRLLFKYYFKEYEMDKKSRGFSYHKHHLFLLGPQAFHKSGHGEKRRI